MFCIVVGRPRNSKARHAELEEQQRRKQYMDIVGYRFGEQHMPLLLSRAHRSLQSHERSLLTVVE